MSLPAVNTPPDPTNTCIPDKHAQRAQLYQTFLDKEERQKFAEFYKELETLYEILSPSPELRDHIEDFNRLADIYVMLRNAYGTKTTFLGDLAHKTEMLVRQNATAHGLDKMTKTVEFDEAALQMLKEGQAPDAGKVINLARSLVEFGTREGEHDPMLMGIAERAEAILEAFTERQTSTLQALDRLKELMEEKRTLEDERKHWRGDASGFPIFVLGILDTIEGTVEFGSGPIHSCPLVFIRKVPSVE